MSQTYEEYERDYGTLLSRVRSFLASSSSRSSRSSLLECQRLLDDARKNAVAMHGLAEIQGDALKISQAQQRTERDLVPLRKEVARALEGLSGKASGGGGNSSNMSGSMSYRAPSTSTDVEYGNATSSTSLDMDDTQRLIASSEDLLRESQALCASSEDIGNETLGQMGRQREQLERTNRYLNETSVLADRARQILKDMRYKVLRNRIVLYVLIGLLIVANGWAIHHLFTKQKKQD